MAEVQKRGPGKWLIRSYVGRKPNGARIMISRTVTAPHTRDGKRQAVLAGAELDVEALEHRTPTRADVLTVDELARRWIRHKSASWQPRTLRSAEDRVRLHVSPHIGGVAVTELSGADLDRLYSELGGSLSAASIQRVHAAVSGMFSAAVRWGLVDVNPARLAEPPTPKRSPSINVPSDVQREAAWNMPADEFWRSLVRVAIGTGMRREELVGLRWSAVEGGRVTVDTAVTSTRDRLHVGPTKSGRARTFVAGDSVDDVLADWRNNRLTHFGVLPEFVWHSRDVVGPMFPDSVSGWWRRNRGLVGCDGVRFHDWRHWNATYLLACGHSAQTVAKRLGHTVAVLESTYSHYMAGADADAAGSLQF